VVEVEAGEEFMIETEWDINASSIKHQASRPPSQLGACLGGSRTCVTEFAIGCGYDTMYHASGLKGMEWTFELLELTVIEHKCLSNVPMRVTWESQMCGHEAGLCSVSCSPLPRLCIAQISTTPHEKPPLGHFHPHVSLSAHRFRLVIQFPSDPQ
jgi:hypothetical protein